MTTPAEVLAKARRTGFNAYTIYDLVQLNVCKKVETTEGIPTEAHWQIMIEEKVTPYSGCVTDPRGTPQCLWRIYVFTDEKIWLATLKCYFSDAANQDSPTNRKYRRGPMRLVGLDCAGKVQPKVQIQLVSSPLEG